MVVVQDKLKGGIMSLIGKGFNFNSYSAEHKELFLEFSKEFKYFDCQLNNYPSLIERLKIGTQMDMLNKQLILKKNFYDLKEDELVVCKIKICPYLTDHCALDYKLPTVLSKHYICAMRKDDYIKFWFFTSKPKEDTLYSLFSEVDLIGRKIPQYINAHPYILEGTYTKEVDIIREVNPSNIDVNRVLTTLRSSNLIESPLSYDNKYHALLADETRLHKVKKNIDIIYSNNE